MQYEAKKDIPSFYLEEEDTEKMLEIFQYAFDLVYNDISGFKDIGDYEKADEKYLDLMMIESGWTVKIEMDALIKRKIIKLAQYIYSMKGIANGMVFTVKQLLGIDIEIDDGVEEGFILNYNELGIDTILGYAGFFLHFFVLTPILTSEEEVKITKIINFMRWAVNTFEIKQVL